MLFRDISREVNLKKSIKKYAGISLSLLGLTLISSCVPASEEKSAEAYFDMVEAVIDLPEAQIYTPNGDRTGVSAFVDGTLEAVLASCGIEISQEEQKENEFLYDGTDLWRAYLAGYDAEIVNLDQVEVQNYCSTYEQVNQKTN